MKLTRRTVIYIFFSILLLLIVINFMRMMERQAVVLTFSDGQQVILEVADTPEERMLGLFFAESIPQDRGMVFLFEQGEPIRLWTREYRVPVDMIWVDQEFKIVSYETDIPPCDKDPCPVYTPADGRAPYAIMLAAGMVRKQGLQVGEKLNLTRFESS
jgi:uncharacterized protein